MNPDAEELALKKAYEAKVKEREDKEATNRIRNYHIAEQLISQLNGLLECTCMLRDVIDISYMHTEKTECVKCHLYRERDNLKISNKEIKE